MHAHPPRSRLRTHEEQTVNLTSSAGGPYASRARTSSGTQRASWRFPGPGRSGRPAGHGTSGRAAAHRGHPQPQPQPQPRDLHERGHWHRHQLPGAPGFRLADPHTLEVTDVHTVANAHTVANVANAHTVIVLELSGSLQLYGRSCIQHEPEQKSQQQPEQQPEQEPQQQPEQESQQQPQQQPQQESQQQPQQQPEQQPEPDLGLAQAVRLNLKLIPSRELAFGDRLTVIPRVRFTVVVPDFRLGPGFGFARRLYRHEPESGRERQLDQHVGPARTVRERPALAGQCRARPQCRLRGAGLDREQRLGR